MKAKFPTYRYRKDGACRLFATGEEINETIWADTFADFGYTVDDIFHVTSQDCQDEPDEIDQEEQDIIDSLSKEDLIAHAEAIGLKLDMRFSKKTMIDKIMEIQNDSSASD